MNPRQKGYWLGFLGVLLFSLNFAAVKVALRDFDAIFVGLGRGILAAIPAAALLYFTGQPLLKRRHLPSILITCIGVAVAFPLLLALALREAHASHAAVVSGLIPIGTAVLGSWRDRERHSPLFWISALAGSAVVVAYAWWHGGNAITRADLALLGAVLSAAVGFVEGARLAREIGSWQVICWTLVLSAPILVYPVLGHTTPETLHASWQAWLGFLYAGFGSMFLGYYFWYRGLAIGGTARVSQLQLLQPFLALASCALFLDETLALSTILCGVLVVGCVLVCRIAR